MFKNATILIQGALDIEIEKYLNKMENMKKEIISNYEFYIGKIYNKKIIISKTDVGVINSSIATTIALLNYKPDFVINQGIAGSYREDIFVGDIILCDECYNINSYKMPIKLKGEGSNPFEWELNKRAKNGIKTDDKLLNYIFNKIKNCNIKIYKGTIGSGDVFNREYDRIKWIGKTFNNLCEDMESISVYTVCEKFNVPCIGIRIISNNELIKEPLDKSQSYTLQDLIIEKIIK